MPSFLKIGLILLLFFSLIRAFANPESDLLIEAKAIAKVAKDQNPENTLKLFRIESKLATVLQKKLNNLALRYNRDSLGTAEGCERDDVACSLKQYEKMWKEDREYFQYLIDNAFSFEVWFGSDGFPPSCKVTLARLIPVMKDKIVQAEYFKLKRNSLMEILEYSSAIPYDEKVDGAEIADMQGDSPRSSIAKIIEDFKAIATDGLLQSYFNNTSSLNDFIGEIKKKFEQREKIDIEVLPSLIHISYYDKNNNYISRSLDDSPKELAKPLQSFKNKIKVEYQNALKELNKYVKAPLKK